MSSSSDATAWGVRVHWEDLPPELRAALERRLGAPVVEAVTQPKGFSPGLAARLKLEDGRHVFIKAVSEKANPDSPGIHRREAQILAALPDGAPVPRLLWTYDEEGWVALCLEDVEGHHPAEPWTDAELDQVLGALKEMARSLTPSPITTEQTAADAFARTINGWQVALGRGEKRLDGWCTRHLHRLAELEARAPEASSGDTLLNFDVRADNLLITGDRVYILDWPWARTGAWWIDIACMAPSVAMQGGPSPEEVLSRVDLAGVRRESVDAVVCSLAGYFVVRSLEPPPPGLPTVRAFQAAQGRPAMVARADRLGLRSSEDPGGFGGALGRTKGGYATLFKKAVWMCALASGLALITSSTAVAAITPVLISGPSPYAACSSHDNQLTGRTYLNAEVEPTVAAHGTNAIAMFHQDRKSNGGAHGIGVGYSTNSGANWTETTISLTACSSDVQPVLSNMWRASDPWVSIGPDGTAYASALSFNLSVPNNANAVVAATSGDGGATWTNIQPIPGAIFQTADQSTDKNATTADPVHAGVAYTVWDTLLFPTDNPDDNPHTQAYTGPAYFSKTTDGGRTWSQAEVIIDTKNRQQTIGNIVVVDSRNGDLYNFTDLITSPNTPFQGTRSDSDLAFVKSTDGGNTWSQPKTIAKFNSLGVRDPNNLQLRARVGDGLEAVAIDPASGKLYVVYESSTNYQKQLKQSSGAWDNEILLVTSSNGGATWTGPTVIHTANGLPTFTPEVAVNAGRVAVTYYDNRNLGTDTAHWATDYFVEYSTDGGVTWGGEQRITSVSFDMMTAPVARGFFLGDYEGLAASGSGFLAVFVKTNCDAPYPASNLLCAPASSNITPTSNTNPTDVFSASLP